VIDAFAMRCAAWIVVSLASLAAASATPASEDVSTSTVLSVKGGVLRVSSPHPGVLRVEAAPATGFVERASSALVSTAQRPLRQRSDGPTRTIVEADGVRLAVDTSTGRLAFFRTEEREPFLQATATGLAPVEWFGDRGVAPTQRFRIAVDQRLYGLGTYQDGVMNWRGHTVRIAQSNTTSALPVLVSSRGWGLFWHNASRTVFSDDGREFTFSSAIGDAVDYFVIASRDLDGAIAAYRAITGRAPLLPRYAYGYWQSKERYESANELLDVVREHRRRKLPLDTVVLDWNWWPDVRQWSGMTWDAKRFPDPAAMTAALHAQHVRLMVSIWPAVGVDNALYRDLDAIGGLLPGEHWAPARVVDAWRDAPRRVYWDRVRSGLLAPGVDAWWMDATEPTFLSSEDRYITEDLIVRNGRNELGSFARQLNTYSLLATRGAWEMQRAAAPERRVLILTRSSFAGQQRHAAVLWSGDIEGSWAVFRHQISAGLNYALGGMPYWTTDAGGFGMRYRFPRGLDDPAYRELYVRWFQYAAFSPIFRAHGTDVPREIWRFGDENTPEYRALAAMTRLRYRLLPYVYSVAADVTQRDRAFMRPLVMDFAADPRTRGNGEQYLFGPSILVSPVTRALRNRPDVPAESISSDRLSAPDGRSPGVLATYFRGTGFDQKVAERMTEVLRQPWVGALPRELDGQPYSVRFEGRVRTLAAGRYAFHARSNGGVRIRVDGRLVVDAWDNASDARLEGSVDLPADTSVPIVIEHRQFHADTSGLAVTWTYPGLLAETWSADGTAMRYLPRGAGWIDFWTGRRVAGGREVREPVPLERVPLDIRAGSIVPLGPDLQWTDERPADPIELRVYPGADGSTELYEDAGDGYEYEAGAFSRIPIRWNDRARVLTIGPRSGAFPGMIARRTFKVVLVRPGRGVGADESAADRVVAYDGAPVRVELPDRSE
jgi:alpha-D-xyloside xylohydrolase